MDGVPDVSAESEARLGRALRDTSIVIAVRDDLKVVECVNSVDEETVEIVVALNGATDAVREAVEAHPRKLIVTEVGEANLGAAYNAGADAASGRYLLFTDSDCTFGRSTIRQLIRETLDHPVVKGRVVFTSAKGWLSEIIQRSRTFQIADHVNAYSPPLAYDREIIPKIGGYHYSALIHWEEDREFDFRLQLAGIPVKYCPGAVVFHAAQRGVTDLRSAFRYGLGEGIGQELGLFLTPRWWWRLKSDVVSLGECVKTKGTRTALYRVLWLLSYHVGTAIHCAVDPYGVRSKYPSGCGRVYAHPGVAGHSTKLSLEHIKLLRAAHKQQGRSIRPLGVENIGRADGGRERARF